MLKTRYMHLCLSTLDMAKSGSPHDPQVWVPESENSGPLRACLDVNRGREMLSYATCRPRTICLGVLIPLQQLTSGFPLVTDQVVRFHFLRIVSSFSHRINVIHLYAGGVRLKPVNGRMWSVSTAGGRCARRRVSRWDFRFAYR